MSTEPLPVATTPLAIYERAIAAGRSAEELGKLLDLQERWERNQSAKVWADAVTAFQRDCPVIVKRKEAKNFKYAPYEEIWCVAGPICAKHAIVPTYTTKKLEGGIECTCHIRVGTHVEDSTAFVRTPESPRNKTGDVVVNDSQLDGQVISYAKRYALCIGLNIVVAGEDTDAAIQAAPIDEKEAKEIHALLSECNEDSTVFPFQKETYLAWVESFAGTRDLTQIPTKHFQKACNQLKAIIRKQKGGGQ